MTVICCLISDMDKRNFEETLSRALALLQEWGIFVC
jgi:hypothetical protein